MPSCKDLKRFCNKGYVVVILTFTVFVNNFMKDLKILRLAMFESPFRSHDLMSINLAHRPDGAGAAAVVVSFWRPYILYASQCITESFSFELCSLLQENWKVCALSNLKNFLQLTQKLTILGANWFRALKLYI